jgi:hypothetical protein
MQAILKGSRGEELRVVDVRYKRHVQQVATTADGNRMTETEQKQKGYTLAKGKGANRRKPPLALLRRGAGDS